ncbi:PD40 domain-containing protein [Microlunatus antarcticus]
MLGAVVAVCFALVVVYVLQVRHAGSVSAAAAPTVSTVPMADVLAGPHLVFRNATLGADYGKLAAVTLGDPGGARAFGSTSCERVYATASAGVCVTASGGIAPTYAVASLGPDLAPTSSAPLAGLPSRARMSVDGRLVSTTTFITGHSYAASSFSTATVIRVGGRDLPNLETWTTYLPDGQRLVAANRNFWGVTFATDDDTFYATAASGTTTWLVRGSVKERTMRALRTDAECPSLSPDGRHVAYKKRLANPTPGVWRLASLDLTTGAETLLAETRNVDDQVEWLDDASLLYSLPRSGTEATTSDVWRVPSDGSGTPSVLVPYASSPAVVAAAASAARP